MCSLYLLLLFYVCLCLSVSVCVCVRPYVCVCVCVCVCVFFHVPFQLSALPPAPLPNTLSGPLATGESPPYGYGYLPADGVHDFSDLGTNVPVASTFSSAAFTSRPSTASAGQPVRSSATSAGASSSASLRQPSVQLPTSSSALTRRSRISSEPDSPESAVSSVCVCCFSNFLLLALAVIVPMIVLVFLVIVVPVVLVVVFPNWCSQVLYLRAVGDSTSTKSADVSICCVDVLYIFSCCQSLLDSHSFSKVMK